MEISQRPWQRKQHRHCCYGVLGTCLMLSGILGLYVCGHPEQNSVKRILMGGMVKTHPHAKDTIFEHAAVATDNEQCSHIGKQILKRGSAVDAAIASMLCLGVINSHSTGIGGGGFMLVYEKAKTKARVIDFREAAPLLATKDMFHGNATLGVRGGLAVAVPGELRGMQMAHEKYGKLPWKELFQPAIKLCEEGFQISESLGIALKKWKDDVLHGDKCLRNMFVRDGKVLSQGDTVKNLPLAKTLRAIAKTGNADIFYTGKMAKIIVKDVAAKGGVITEKDLLNYKALFKKPLKSDLNGLTMYNVPPPASGAVLAFILNILKGYQEKNTWRKHPDLVLHRTIEAFKFAYARRMELADPDFEPTVNSVVKELMSVSMAAMIRTKIDDNATFDIPHYGGKYNVPLTTGTTHLVVVGRNGDAVSVTSTVNGYLGAKFRSCKLGFVYNNEMDDFSAPGMSNEFGLPPSEVNFIKPGKRPQSSSVPVIILDKSKDVRFVAGGSGGSIITTATAQVIMNHFWHGMSLKDAIQQPRVHAQLIPDVVFVETRMSEDIIKKLEKRHHKVNSSDESHAVVQAIARINGGWQKICKTGGMPAKTWEHFCKKGVIHRSGLYAESDYRKGGLPDGF